MEVRIGVFDTPKELTLEIDGMEPEDLVSAVEDAVAGNAPVLWLTDGRGRRVGVPSDKVAYVEVVLEDDTHRVGFGKA